MVITFEHLTFREGIGFTRQIVPERLKLKHNSFGIISEHPNLDGIFVITGLVAVGDLSCFNDIGIKIPEQVAVIGLCLQSSNQN